VNSKIYNLNALTCPNNSHISFYIFYTLLSFGEEDKGIWLCRWKEMVINRASPVALVRAFLSKWVAVLFQKKKKHSLIKWQKNASESPYKKQHLVLEIWFNTQWGGRTLNYMGYMGFRKKETVHFLSFLRAHNIWCMHTCAYVDVFLSKTFLCQMSVKNFKY
jgi:hypothetical protein